MPTTGTAGGPGIFRDPGSPVILPLFSWDKDARNTGRIEGVLSLDVPDLQVIRP
jgi:hypothetical protein